MTASLKLTPRPYPSLVAAERFLVVVSVHSDTVASVRFNIDGTGAANVVVVVVVVVDSAIASVAVVVVGDAAMTNDLRRRRRRRPVGRMISSLSCTWPIGVAVPLGIPAPAPRFRSDALVADEAVSVISSSLSGMVSGVGCHAGCRDGIGCSVLSKPSCADFPILKYIVKREKWLYCRCYC